MNLRTKRLVILAFWFAVPLLLRAAYAAETDLFVFEAPDGWTVETDRKEKLFASPGNPYKGAPSLFMFFGAAGEGERWADPKALSAELETFAGEVLAMPGSDWSILQRRASEASPTYVLDASAIVEGKPARLADRIVVGDRAAVLVRLIWQEGQCECSDVLQRIIDSIQWK